MRWCFFQVMFWQHNCDLNERHFLVSKYGFCSGLRKLMPSLYLSQLSLFAVQYHESWPFIQCTVSHGFDSCWDLTFFFVPHSQHVSHFSNLLPVFYQLLKFSSFFFVSLYLFFRWISTYSSNSWKTASSIRFKFPTIFLVTEILLS